MATRKAKSLESVQADLPLGKDSIPPAPPFHNLLNSPSVKQELPKDFDKSIEAAHLQVLWNDVPAFHKYAFEEFVHAGGSGMVFRVKEHGSESVWALKVPRQKALKVGLDSQVSPFSPAEISALRQVSHPNLVRLHEQVKSTQGVVGLITTYVHRPNPLDEYLRDTLSKDPDPKRTKGISPFSPKRLENASIFLVGRIREIASALAHMHEKGLYHCDVKPANILIGSSREAILTDLGSCVQSVDIDKTNENSPLRIRFTWTYAHPELHNLAKGDVRSISGGGLKVSVNIDPTHGLARFDLFALGRTIQEALAALVTEFGERCYASYGFRFLHFIACLLLDGTNAPVRDRIVKTDERWFVSDVAMDYPVELFDENRIGSAAELVNRLDRFDRNFSWNGRVPELDAWQPDYVNTGSGKPAPYTSRVAALFKHPAVRRLRKENQLGWTKEVYPGATHSRWSHTLGVLANVCDYYNSLLADPELPTTRILLNDVDIEHALVAAILHDIGQTAFGHDLEVVNLPAFDHRNIIPRLLKDKRFGSETLEETISRHWQNVSISRVFSIIGVPLQAGEKRDTDLATPVDGLARDMIDGPIDADKLDYLIRDSSACGVHYGLGIDRERFLKTLTVDVKKVGGRTCRLALAYRAKGAAAVESLLLARYQMYGAVYWHHTYRCIQAMFVHAASKSFGKWSSSGASEIARVSASFYSRVVCGLPIDTQRKGEPERPHPDVSSEPALDFIWRFADSRDRKLIERIATRNLYKRVYEIRTGELGQDVDYSSLQTKLSPNERVSIAELLEKFFISAIEKKIAVKHGPTDSVSEARAREIAGSLAASGIPLVVVDYPIKGIPDEKNYPLEIGDAARKYIAGRVAKINPPRDVFNRVRRLQIEIATVRVFAEPDLHELIIRYLEPSDVEDCVYAAMSFIKTQQ
jgi:HD superfamily phosphohydrolase